MSELLPCPFCGGETRFSDWNFIQGFRFNCTRCRAVFILDSPKNTFLKKSEKELEKVAIEIWNRRHYPPEVEKAVERMKPKKVIRHQWSDNSKGFLALHCDYNCPVCDGELEDMVDFCPHEGCGQALDWSE